MSEESEREEIKDETHQLQDEEQEELDEVEEEEVEEEAKTMEEVRGAEWEEDYSKELNEKKTTVIIEQIFHLIYL